MNNLVKNIGIWAVILMVVLVVVKQFDARQPGKGSIPYSEFMESAKSGKVESVMVEGRTIKWTSTDKKTFTTYSPGDIWMVGDLSSTASRSRASRRRSSRSSRRSSSPGSRCCC